MRGSADFDKAIRILSIIGLLLVFAMLILLAFVGNSIIGRISLGFDFGGNVFGPGETITGTIVVRPSETEVIPLASKVTVTFRDQKVTRDLFTLLSDSDIRKARSAEVKSPVVAVLKIITINQAPGGGGQANSNGEGTASGGGKGAGAGGGSGVGGGISGHAVKNPGSSGSSGSTEGGASGSDDINVGGGDSSESETYSIIEVNVEPNKPTVMSFTSPKEAKVLDVRVDGKSIGTGNVYILGQYSRVLSVYNTYTEKGVKGFYQGTTLYIPLSNFGIIARGPGEMLTSLTYRGSVLSKSELEYIPFDKRKKTPGKETNPVDDEFSQRNYDLFLVSAEDLARCNGETTVTVKECVPLLSAYAGLADKVSTKLYTKVVTTDACGNRHITYENCLQYTPIEVNSEEGSNEKRTYSVIDSASSDPVARITITDGGVGVSFLEKGSLDSACYNGIRDDSEEGIDCGGDCNACKGYGFEGNNLLLWAFAVLAVFLFAWKYFDLDLYVKTKSLVMKGRRALRERDFVLALGYYNQIRHTFSIVTSVISSPTLRALCLDYYVELKMALEKEGISVKRDTSFADLPRILYSGGSLVLSHARFSKRLAHDDISRVNMLVNDGIEAFESGDMKTAVANYHLIRSIYGHMKDKGRVRHYALHYYMLLEQKMKHKRFGLIGRWKVYFSSPKGLPSI